ncbi:MAG: zinc ribbon domain-containing protein [Deltaproteobacteria bacterium]|nr:zinc ribbon domain-containing protein [Deltaproteobacteria bacterium]
MGDNSIQCPKCGHENKTSAIECDKCGVTLSLVLNKSLKNDMAKPDTSPADSQEAGSPNLSICPKCGHDVLPSAAECIKCGIIFSKYFEFQERLQNEEQEKAEAEEIRLEQEKKEAEEIKKAEAIQKEAEKEEQKRAETLKKQQDKKDKEEKEKTEVLLIEQEEKEREEKEKDETVAKEKQTVEQLEIQIASLKSEAASLKMDTETLKKAEREAIKKNEASQEKIESLNQETDTLKLETESLKKEKVALDEAEAKKQKAQDTERKAEEEKAETLRKERKDKQKRTETILKTLVPKPNFEELLKKYEGEEIGINYDDPAEIKKAQLAKVNADHFSVLVMENELLYSYPFGNILSIVEAADGVPVDISGETANYPIVVRVLHLMVKKKWSFI